MNYRHGDLALIGIDKLPDNLKKSDTKILMKGSGGNNHEIDNGDVYFINNNQFIFGYLAAKNTKLFHLEHGEGKGKNKEAKIEDGIYELRKQNEETHTELKQVED
jgi:hypothetical protein